jgi:lipoate-protein ligase B
LQQKSLTVENYETRAVSRLGATGVTVAVSADYIRVMDWGLLGYGESVRRQLQLVEERCSGVIGDSLILVEHHPAVTIGRSGGQSDLLMPEAFFHREGIELHRVSRGGKATFHEPGQLVIYPIIKLKDNDIGLFVGTLLESAAAVLRVYGLRSEFKDGRPGLWVRSQKIASVGICIKERVTYHGLSINVNNDLRGSQLIVPCGHAEEVFTSMAREYGQSINMVEVKKFFIGEFKKRFQYENEPGQSTN